MKLTLSIIAVLCITSTLARPIFLEQEEVTTSPSDIKDYLVAFLDGFDIEKYANSTADCQKEGGVFYDDFAAGIKNYVDHHYYEGSLNISDALGDLSPISRTCYDTEVQFVDSFDLYWSQFTGIKDFLSKVTVNAMSNVKPIKAKGTLILTEYLTTKNYTKCAFYTGEIASLVFAFNDGEPLFTSGNLGYTEADPFAADPINHIMWTIFEGLYKFGINSQMVTMPTIKNCQEGILNMAVLDEQAILLYKKGKKKDAWFAFTDSLTFSHQIVDGCYHTYKEFSSTLTKVKKEVIDGGKLWSNVLNNLFFVVSDLFASYSQIFHGDYLQLIGVLGSVVYRVFVSGTS
jgi:hypothetical protein